MAVLTAIVAVLLIVGYNIMLDYDKAQGVLMRTADKVAGEIEAEITTASSQAPSCRRLLYLKKTHI